MSTFSSHLIRPATGRDAQALARLAELYSAARLSGDILLAEENGVPVAATSLADGRMIADPFRFTAPTQAALRARAHALGAVVAALPLRDRLRAAFAPVRLAAPR